MGGNRSEKDKSLKQMMGVVCAPFINQGRYNLRKMNLQERRESLQRLLWRVAVLSESPRCSSSPRRWCTWLTSCGCLRLQRRSCSSSVQACSLGLSPRWLSALDAVWTADKHGLLTESKRGQRKGHTKINSHTSRIIGADLCP